MTPQTERNKEMTLVKKISDNATGQDTSWNPAIEDYTGETFALKKFTQEGTAYDWTVKAVPGLPVGYIIDDEAGDDENEVEMIVAAGATHMGFQTYFVETYRPA